MAGDGNGLIHHDQPLWYFPFLVTSLAGAWIATALSDRVSPLLGWGLALAWAGFATVHDGARLPWDLDIAGIGVLMILAGRMLRRHYPRLQPWIETPGRALPLAALLLVLLAGISALNGPTNINGAKFGASGVLFVAAALAGTGMVLLLAARIPPTRLARTISAETLTIFALHIYLVHVASKLPHPASWAGQQLAMVVSAGAVVLLCLPIARILQPALSRIVTLRSPVARDPGPGGAPVRYPALAEH